MPVITENKQASSLIFDTCPNTHTFVMSVYCSEFSCELPFALDVLHDRLDHLWRGTLTPNIRCVQLQEDK